MDNSKERRLGPLKQEPAPLRNKIIMSLRRAIETGVLEPGTRLIEKDLCAQLGVSRTSLREALRQLEAEGVLAPIGNRGVAVVTISVEDAANVYRIRAVLEPLIVAQFVEHASDEETDELVDSSQRLKRAYRSGVVEAILVGRREFYDRICTGARNSVAFDILNKLTLVTSSFRRGSVARPARQKQSIAEIDTIVDAIKRRDSKAAQAATATHVVNAARSALADFPERSYDKAAGRREGSLISDLVVRSRVRQSV